jgi:hypothetical protein
VSGSGDGRGGGDPFFLSSGGAGVKIIPTRLSGTLLVLLGVSCGTTLLAQEGPRPGQPPGAPPGAGSQPPATAQAPPPPQTLRYSRNLPGDSKPMILDSDTVVTWVAKGQRVILLDGQILVQQGAVRLRCQAGVAFINLDRLQRTGILHLDFYAEQCTLEDGTMAKRAARALVDLNTRGELRLNSHKAKVVQQPRPDAPLFLRAIAELNGPPAGREETSEAPPTRPRTAPQATPPLPPPALGRRPVPPRPPAGVPGEPPPSVVPVPPGWRPPAGTARPPSVSPPPGGGRQAPGPSPQASRKQPESGGETVVIQASAAKAVQTDTVRADGGVVQAQFVPPGPGATAPGPGARFLQATPGQPGPLRQYSVLPRSSAGYQFKSETLPTGEQAFIVTGGVSIAVRNPDGSVLVDIEADNAVIWSRGGISRETFEGLRRPEGQSSRQLEFYLSGNVQVRQKGLDGDRILTADEIYLDVNRNVAIAAGAGLQFTRPGLPQPIILRADELRQVAANKFEVIRAEIFSSKLPSDPGLKIVFADATLEELRVPRRDLFGNPVIDRRTGQPLTETQRPVRGRQTFLEVEDVPFFYLPYFRADAEDPLGPIQGFRFGANRIFGAQFYLTLDGYDLFGIQKVPNTRWRIDTDYLSRRGPALGTQYDFANQSFLGLPARVSGLFKVYGIHDDAYDILGGFRGTNENPPTYRGRVLFRENVQDLPDGFSFQTQTAAFSDRNFYEQYFKLAFDQDINQETFLYVKQQQGNYAWTGIVEPRLRRWVNETERLPQVDGYALGLDPFGLGIFTYNGHAGIGYDQLKTSEDMLPLVSTTDNGVATGRADLYQDLSLPFYAGPVKVVPYALLDLTYYTQDLNGNQNGRAWGGGGVRASLPLSRLYPDARSLLMNVNGLNHKIVVSTNYRIVGSTDSFKLFPQLDRLNDDATDQALRDIKPVQPQINPRDGQFLVTSPLFDPQTYAIRRLVDNRTETRDDIQVVQFDVRQRLQTKRGFPGQQHIIDWMVLDLSASFFPAPNRDNFGEPVSFIEYDYLWNVGDRTALVSTGWFDPFANGARVFTLGAFLNRPDRTNFYLGYRQIDPVQSKAVTGSATYIFSPKYAMTLSSTYDFGTQQSLSNSFVFTRMGTDLNVGLGFTYNALQNNFGVLFEVLPNLVASRAGSGASLLGGGGLGGGSMLNGR